MTQNEDGDMQVVAELVAQVQSLKNEIVAQEEIILWLKKELDGLKPQMTFNAACYGASSIEVLPKDSMAQSVFIK